MFSNPRKQHQMKRFDIIGTSASRSNILENIVAESGNHCDKHSSEKKTIVLKSRPWAISERSLNKGMMSWVSSGKNPGEYRSCPADPGSYKSSHHRMTWLRPRARPVKPTRNQSRMMMTQSLSDSNLKPVLSGIYAFWTNFRGRYCDLKGWQYKSSAEFKRSDLPVVILLRVQVLEPGGPVGGPNSCAGSCVFLRDNVRLPLTILTIIHSASVPIPQPTTCWAPEQSCLVSTSIK